MKTRFRLAMERRKDCAEKHDSSVRYLLMDTVNGTLTHVAKHMLSQDPRTYPSLHDVLSLLRNLLRALEVIHKRGVIHGDIHMGNIALLNETSYGFIDFGKALFADEIRDETQLQWEPLSNLHCSLSPYMLNGRYPSYRDDAFNAFWVSAVMLNGPELLEYCHHFAISKDKNGMMKLKNETLLFEYPGGLPHISLIPGVAEHTREQVRIHIETVLELARNVTDPHSLPDYNTMLVELDAVLGLLPQ
jgi:serine/threonine protein kinase